MEWRVALSFAVSFGGNDAKRRRTNIPSHVVSEPLHEVVIVKYRSS